jgi:hypothetical protein
MVSSVLGEEGRQGCGLFYALEGKKAVPDMTNERLRGHVCFG